MHYFDNLLLLKQCYFDEKCLFFEEKTLFLHIDNI